MFSNYHFYSDATVISARHNFISIIPPIYFTLNLCLRIIDMFIRIIVIVIVIVGLPSKLLSVFFYWCQHLLVVSTIVVLTCVVFIFLKLITNLTNYYTITVLLLNYFKSYHIIEHDCW